MDFIINGRNWHIRELEQDKILKLYQEEYENGTYCFGMTKYPQQTIYINKDMCVEVKKQTLYHELMHCYLFSYFHEANEFGLEALCDISANSHDIIHDIATEYFKNDIDE